MVELGMAIAWEKPVFLFRDDFRSCTDSEVYPLNLMLFTGLPEMGWEAYWYGSVEEIADLHPSGLWRRAFDQLWITRAAGGPRRGTHPPPRAHPADFCPQGQRQGKAGAL